MSAQGGFNFNRDFSKSAAGSHFLDGKARLPVPHAEHVAMLERARSEAFELGLAEGRAQQVNIENMQLGAALDRIAQQMQVLIPHMKALEDNARQEALLFARIFATKLAGRLVEQSPMTTIEATARTILDDLRGAAHVAIRVSPALVDSCKNRLALLMRENGLEPKLFVFPDPGIATGDCRIEWAEGGIVRDRDRLEYLIDQSLDLLLPRRS
jgi:flagellar assembly protein FliH